MIIKIYTHHAGIFTVDNATNIISGRDRILGEISEKSINKPYEKFREDYSCSHVNDFTSFMSTEIFEKEGRYNFIYFERESIKYLFTFSHNGYICNNEGKTITKVDSLR